MQQTITPPKGDLEEFDSGWEKNVWDFAILVSDKRNIMMMGPIDYRYCLSYGHLTMEYFNCCEYKNADTNDDTTLNFSQFSFETTKKIDIDIQYYWYKNNIQWHFTTDFYPTCIEVGFYKYTNTTNKKQKEIYELALLMDSNRKYKNILSGPIVYEKLFNNIKHLYFNELQPYIKGDITVLKKYGKCKKKIQNVNNFYSVFNVKVNFDTNNEEDQYKVELWNINYDKKHKWDHYKSEQKEEKYDIIFVTNKQKQIKYILNNVIINVIDKIIKFSGSYEEYKSGDYEKLNAIAIKIKGICVTDYKFWYDENNESLISDYAITYKAFKFPNIKKKPFKAFFYRFETLNKKYEWKKYKNNFQTNNHKLDVSLAYDDYENVHYLPKDNHIRMDSNLQIIHNYSNSNTLNSLTLLDIESPSVQSIIHPLILSNTSSVKSIECIKSPTQKFNKSYEMIVNMSNEKWTLTPKTNSTTESCLSPPFKSTTESCLSPPSEHRMHQKDLKLKQSPYFKGDVSLPKNNTKPIVQVKKIDTKPVQNKNIEVWDFYIAKYHFEPTNASQLMNFSRHSQDVDTLKYIEARKQFNTRKNKSKT